MSNALPFRLPPPRNARVDVLVIAGEHSGDQHSAELVRTLLAQSPGTSVAALGGPELAGAGAQLLYDLTASSVVGLVEVLKNYSFFRALFEETLRWIEQYSPRAVLFVDYPGLNLRIAEALRDRKLSVKGGGKIKALFYISPQIWAWKAKRRFSMARNLDALAVIFPFEGKYYADTSIPVTFVGHPFLADKHISPVRYDPDGPVLLLPGSRQQAVRRIFPQLLAGFEALKERTAVVLYPSEQIQAALREANPPENVQLVPVREHTSSHSSGTIAAAAVLTSSGTMSMHCALAGIPGAICYRAHPLTYLLGRMLVKIQYLGIANLLLDEPMYPEFIQNAATPEALARELKACLHDPARIARTHALAERLKSILRQTAGMDAASWLRAQIGP